MMNKLAKIISVLLILSMFCTCVYATDVSTTPYSDGVTTEEQVPEVPEDTEDVEEPEEIKDYIKDFELAKSETDKDNKVSLTFGWTIDDVDGDLAGIEAKLYEDLKMESEPLSSKQLGAEATKVSFDDLSKAKPYYVVLNAYTERDGEKVYSEPVKGMGIYLEKPVIKEITAKGTIVDFTFDPVEGASKYVVSYETAGVSTETEVTKSPVNVPGLSQNSEYSFKVKAVFEAKDDAADVTYTCETEWSDASNVVTGNTVLTKPVLTLDAYNKGAILTWDKNLEATSYEIWRYYNKKWTLIKTVNANTLTYKNTGLTVNKKYYYRVRAVREAYGETLTSEYSDSKSITAKTYLTNSTFRLGYNTGTVKRNSAKYQEGSATKTINKTKLKKGTKVTILSRKPVGRHSMAKVKTSSGAIYWIKSCNIRYNAPYTTKDYTKKVKEDFVNNRGYSSKTKYLLVISHYTQKVYLYTGSKGNWKLKTTYKCVTGKSSTRTPQGTFKLYKKHARGSTYKYVSYFRNKNSFHTRPWGTKTMGRPASNGCIRMYDSAAKYIYKSIPKNTTVVSY